jgi:hypothetical protein
MATAGLNHAAFKLLSAVTACTGSCNYINQGGQYVFHSGACTGGGGCPSCPGDPEGATAGTLFANPTDGKNFFQQTGAQPALSIQCSTLTAVLNCSNQSNSWKRLSIGLGVTSVLLAGGLVYALFFRS